MSGPNGIVQAKLVGGFGNQLHQYVAARKYAETVGAMLEVPDWPGRLVFALPEREWTCELPEVNDGSCGVPPELEWGETNIRLGGYFQTQRWVGKLSRGELKRWLQVDSRWVSACMAGVEVHTAAHVRQGDYIGHPLFANVPKRSYIRAAGRYGREIDTWVEQDHPRLVTGLDARLHFLPDFITLMSAKVLFRANSTFSWWAAVLGSASEIYAPVVEDHAGEYDAMFAVGNWPRCADTSRVGIRIDDLLLPA